MTPCERHRWSDAIIPAGYEARAEWATRMRVTHRQDRCDGCRLYVLWTPWPTGPIGRMSCFLTADAVLSEAKDVTRRSPGTWRQLDHHSAGRRLVLIEKGQGIPKGDRQRVLNTVWIVNVRVEPLGQLLSEPDGTAREGVPHLSGETFMRWWADSHGHRKVPDRDLGGLLCRRIEWSYEPRGADAATP